MNSRFYLVYFLVILFTFCAVEGSKKSEELEGKEAQVCEDITIPMCQVSWHVHTYKFAKIINNL